MAKSVKLFPSRVSGALKTFATRILGVAVLVLSLWMMGALFMYDPYLDGFGAASTFGPQHLMGNVVGFLRFGVGFVPTLFLGLCLMRLGLLMFLRRDEDVTPEYNLLRGFIALCAGAAGFGLIAPRLTMGGMIGAIAATDVTAVLGGTLGAIVGALLLGVFFVMAAVLLHIRMAHIKQIGRAVARMVRIILSAFHLVKYEAATEEDASDDADEDAAPDEATADDATVPEPARRAQRRSARRKARSTSASDAGTSFQDFQLPYPELLEASGFGRNQVTNDLKRNAAALEAHFEEFGVYGHVVGIKPGPIVTLYEFEPESGMRIAKITDTVKDMTRAMATENIRIAHIPGTPYLGVEMVNVNRQTVRYREIIADPMFVESKYKIPLALGVNIGGKPMYYDLAKMPHMMIAGRTGSGKSVFIQSLITSIVYHFTPDKCKLIIIDPKGSDFGFWDDIPHLITPIVKTDPQAAINALKWAVREMDARYNQLQVLNARNIESYNEIAAQKRASGEVVTRQVAVGTDEETGELMFETQTVDISDMPYIVIIIDEVADLMMLARKEVEACIQRIAQKARAAGIHLVMATQRPDATTITGVIKANFPTRVSFQARSNIDSMTTLGEKGAEQLLAMGDMLFSEAGRVPVRIHGAFISDAELKAIGDFLRAQGAPEYAAGVTEDTESVEGGIPGAISPAAAKESKDADLYTQAKEFVIRDKKPTISYIQRRLGIGYNKAASLMERMEEEGIVSAPDANNKRHVL